MLWRSALFVMVAVVVASTLGGCGGTTDPKQRVLAAARTTASQTVAVNLTLEGSTAFSAAYPLVVARAAFSFPKRLGYERVTIPPEATPRNAYLVFLPNKVLLAPIVSGGTALPDGASWASAPLTGPASVEAHFPRFVAQAEGLNAQLLLDEISWGTESVSLVGERVIDHIPLTEYKVSIDLKRVLSHARGPGAGATRAAVRQQLKALGTRKLAQVSVWVDALGRIVRLRAAYPGSGLGTVSMHLSNFGVKFATSLPPEPSVTPLVTVAPLAEGAGWPWVLGARPRAS